jgi:uncharacterized membrane protein (UPF0127 family)
MEIHHYPTDANSDSAPRVLASNVERATSLYQSIRGLMFRGTLPEDYAFVIEFNRRAYRDIHTLFVQEPIDVIWLQDNTVEKIKRMYPYKGLGVARADTIIEFPAKQISNINPGDTIKIQNPQ